MSNLPVSEMTAKGGKAVGLETLEAQYKNREVETHEYVLLRSEGAGMWEQHHHVEARNAQEAICNYVERLEKDADGTWVAVLARSWRPMTATPKVTTTLELKPA